MNREKYYGRHRRCFLFPDSIGGRNNQLSQAKGGTSMRKPQKRITDHPILPVPERKKLHFTFQGKSCEAYEGEVISTALFARGIKIFGHHHKDGSPQGIFCANGQCSQCTVIADGLPVKACMTEVLEGMKISPCKGNPELPEVMKQGAIFAEIPSMTCDVLIIGGGPSGISAAIELGRFEKEVILVDDKGAPGGKLVLQTHTFFGSLSDCYAGTRGIDIATKLSEDLKKQKTVRLWLNSAAVAVFYDKKVGILKEGRYVLVEPKILLIAAGAREKALTFPGCDLPGVYGAGAFQTLLNRDLVKPSERLFIIGGGNVGIIAGYHALQAGIEVIGLVEALPKVGGYAVHADKLARFGVPLYTSHTVLRCDGSDEVETITIGEIDSHFIPLEGTEKTFKVDTVLVAVGLNPIDELTNQAKTFGMEVFATGDAEEIAEASAAMFSGRIKGLELAGALGEKITIPTEWREKNEILKSKPGAEIPVRYATNGTSVYPVFHCFQEIPCNPCTEVCPNNSIFIKEGGLMGIPRFQGKCVGCLKCVAICPGLAITLVDCRKSDIDKAMVTIPFELHRSFVEEGREIDVVDVKGEFLHRTTVLKRSDKKFQDRTLLVSFEMPRSIAARASGIRIFKPEKAEASTPSTKPGKTIICRCERVAEEEIRELLRGGIRDLNELKFSLRCGMGACGGKTCTKLLERLAREEGVPPEEMTPLTLRPLEMEAPLGIFAGIEG
jgi:sarcosine oxidase, subunit alpha